MIDSTTKLPWGLVCPKVFEVSSLSCASATTTLLLTFSVLFKSLWFHLCVEQDLTRLKFECSMMDSHFLVTTSKPQYAYIIAEFKNIQYLYVHQTTPINLVWFNWKKFLWKLERISYIIFNFSHNPLYLLSSNWIIQIKSITMIK